MVYLALRGSNVNHARLRSRPLSLVNIFTLIRVRSLLSIIIWNKFAFRCQLIDSNVMRDNHFTEELYRVRTFVVNNEVAAYSILETGNEIALCRNLCKLRKHKGASRSISQELSWHSYSPTLLSVVLSLSLAYGHGFCSLGLMQLVVAKRCSRVHFVQRDKLVYWTTLAWSIFNTGASLHTTLHTTKVGCQKKTS